MSSEPAELESILRAVQSAIMAPFAPLESGAEKSFAPTLQTESAADCGEPTAACTAARLQLYRQHILKRLFRTICASLPLTTTHLGAACESQIHQFFAAAQTRSVYLRDVGFEFVTWAAPRWGADPTLPVYLTDLGRYELAALAAARAPDDLPEPAEPAELVLELDRKVRLSRMARLYHFAFPVHQLPKSIPREPETTALLAYRDRDQRVQMLVLSPRAAAILTGLWAQATLRQAVVQACQTATQSAAQPIDETVLIETAQLLADLAERGVILGAAPEAL